jgi:membrane associated rhomboid family serine protease
MSRHYEVSDDDQHQPLTWVQGRPLFATHIIVALLVATMLATTLLLAFGSQGFLAALRFDSVAVLSGQAWRVLTYGLVNPPGLGFVVDMVLLVMFGREVEKFLGRRSFLRLYVFLYLIPPLLLTALGVWRPQMLSGQSGALAIFVAFATLYPAATMLFNLLAGWIAAALVGIYTLVALAGRDWPGLIALWSTTGYAYAYIRHAQGNLSFSLPKLPSLAGRAPDTHERPVVTPSVRPKPNRPALAEAKPAPKDDMAEVDALLDKISRSGLQSLTPRELDRLSAAQSRLARRLDRPTA